MWFEETKENFQFQSEIPSSIKKPWTLYFP